MGKIPDHILEEIRSKISISEVVSQYVHLTPKGGRLWGLCPFHDEKTPSFTVNEQKGFYHCFGCGKGGRIFNFIMDIEQLSFVEAVKLLADKSGVVIAEESEVERLQRNDREVLLDLYNKISNSFTYILQEREEAEGARKYLVSRGIGADMIAQFAIGYAPADPSWLHSFLTARNYSPEILEKSGLFSRNHATYPLFTDRIMFPIRDTRGRVIAFGGRALDSGNSAKYINTPETILFRKRDNLFGFHQALNAIRKEGEVFVTEGYFDVVALTMSGIRNAVAPLGTAFTESQARLLKRYAGRCVLFFDSDTAGMEAATKAIMILEKIGMESAVIDAGKSKDPASIVEDQGMEALQNVLKKQLNSFNYLVKKAINTYDVTLPDGKLAVFKEVKPYIELIDSEIKKQSSIKILSDVLDLDDRVIYAELRNSAASSYQRAGTTPAGTTLQQNYKSSERIAQERIVNFDSEITKLPVDLYLMLTVINNRKYFQDVRNSISDEDMLDARAAEIFAALEESLREGAVSFENLLEQIEDPRTRLLIEGCYGIDEFSIGVEAKIAGSVRALKLRTLVRKQREVEQQIKRAAINGLQELELKNLLYEKKFIDEEIRTLRKG